MQSIEWFGTVLLFDRLKGFGFLETADGRDLFFHHSQIQVPGPAGARKVVKGQRVTYEIGINPNRKNEIAVNVTPVASEIGGDDDRN
jgi:cold shock CspA family protein